MQIVEQTLVEQLQISDVEINNRKELLEISNDDINALVSTKSIIEENLEEIVNRFYDNQTKIDEIALLIGDSDTLAKLQMALRKYIIELFSGFYDSEYVNNRLRIGMVHKRIGVEPKLYLSAVRTLKKIIFDIIELSINNHENCKKIKVALDKLLYFDTTLVFDTYIGSLVGEIESAKHKTEEYARSLEEKVAQRTKQLEELSRIDPLTNLYNQRALYDYLRRELLSAKRNATELSLVYFDVDDFKQINDVEGHMKGDEVLKSIGQIIANNIREVDVPCRFGGDEFVLILPNCDVEGAKRICNKIYEELAKKYPEYSLSLGIAQTGTDEYVDSSQLIKLADEKMYLAKQEKGFQIRC